MTAKWRSIRRAGSFCLYAVPRMRPRRLLARRRSRPTWHAGLIGVALRMTTCRRCSASYNRARAAGSFDDGIRSALERVLVSPDFLFRIEADPARRCSRDLSIASPMSSWLRDCRSSCGAVFRTTLCWTWRFAASCMSRRCWSSKFRACSPIPARAPRWSRISSKIGCRLVTYGCSIRTAPSFPGSTTTSVPRS